MISFDESIDQPWFNHFRLPGQGRYAGDMTFLGSTYPANLMRHYYEDSDKRIYKKSVRRRLYGRSNLVKRVHRPVYG